MKDSSQQVGVTPSDLKGMPNLVVASPEGEVVDIPELVAAVRWGTMRPLPTVMNGPGCRRAATST